MSTPLTTRELIAQLQEADPTGERHVIAYCGGAIEDYVNVRSVPLDEEGHAVVIELSDDFDTRQW
jgi:hypothetical protein